MWDYIINHQPEFWLVLGMGLLALEVITGFSSGIFLFAGLGALICGGLMQLGLIPETEIAGVATTGIASGIMALLLWKPLKKLQGSQAPAKDNSSDFVGLELTLEQPIEASQPGQMLYSGINWKLQLEAGEEPIAAGEKVVVTSVEVGRFIVKSCRSQ